MVYPTKSIIAKINESFTPSLTKPIINIIWTKFIPPRVKLAVWLENLEKLKTGDFLVEKGIIDPPEAACPFCSTDMESNSHILFSCRFAWNTWMNIVEWWGLSTGLHNQCQIFSIQWLGLVNSRKHQRIWGLILGYGKWSQWHERNKIKFNMMTPNFHRFVYSLKIRIGIWAKKMLGYNGSAPQNSIYNIGSILLQL